MRLPLLRPDWPVPPGVQAAFTLRGTAPADGASRGAYRYLNLGDHVGDAPAAVAQNRSWLQDALGARPVFLQQVHGRDAAVLRPGTADGVQADAAVTSTRQLACTILVADCLPVLLAAADGSVVAAAHAGWRGLAAGVLAQAVAVLRQQLVTVRPGAADLPIVAWLGPCIGPSAFEVGAEVRQAFLAGDAAAGRHFVACGRGKYLADLPGLARARLRAAGVGALHGNDGGDAWCTVQRVADCFSHRRDQRQHGATGRMAACIWRN